MKCFALATVLFERCQCSSLGSSPHWGEVASPKGETERGSFLPTMDSLHRIWTTTRKSNGQPVLATSTRRFPAIGQSHRLHPRGEISRGAHGNSGPASDLASRRPSGGRRTFASLYGLESFARASVSSVIPIQAYDILQDKQGVSILYTIVGADRAVGDAVHADADRALFAALDLHGRRACR